MATYERKIGNGAPVIPTATLFDVETNDVRCPDCKTSTVIEDYQQGTMVCQSCGIVVQKQVISDDAEWRDFADDMGNRGDMNRVGMAENPILAGSGGLSTMIGTGGSAGMVRVQHASALDATTRALTNAYWRLQRIAADIGLPKMAVDRTLETLKRVYECPDFKRRKNSEAIIIACLYGVCKKENLPRTLKELCACTDTDKSEVGKVFIKVKRLKLFKRPEGETPHPPPTGDEASGAESMIERYANMLGVPPQVGQIAKGVLRAFFQINLNVTRQLSTLAASAIYMAVLLTNSQRTADQVGAACHVAGSTIKQIYSIMYPYRLKLVPPQLTSIAEALPESSSLAETFQHA